MTMSDLYIAIEGVIGAGKTSLAEKLAPALGAELMLEPYTDNPFLKDFYSDKRRYALSTQLFFLLARYQQQINFQQTELFSEAIVSDYLFAKDRIFANMNLSDAELQLYNQIAGILEKQIVRPQLIIYLRASNQRLLQNIMHRGRSYEENMEIEYIARLNRAYEHFFNNYKMAPLITVNTEKYDLIENEAHFELLLSNIRGKISGHTTLE
jgi:deoxyguanosine kinase